MDNSFLPPLDIPALLRQYGLRPNKGLGQNFLVDDSALRKIVEAAGIGKEDAVLEIGPGLGSLTRYLAVAARKVVAVELDAGLIPPLKSVLDRFDNVRVVEGDILQLNPADLMGESGYEVVANIPYYITSALFRHLLGVEVCPRRMVLTVQEEMAMRINAPPGEMSLLTLSVQVYGKPSIAAHIPAGAFYPPPKVDSAVVRVDLYPSPLLPASLLPSFFRLAKAGFSQKRKTLRNALSAGMGWSPAQAEAALQAAGIDPKRRAETVSLEEWGEMVRRLR